MSETLPVELWDIEKIKPYPRNAKIHSDEQVKKLAKACLLYTSDAADD